MRTRILTNALIVVISSVMAPGCLINSSSETIVQPDAERCTVDFESDDALSIFQAKVQRRYEHGKGLKSTSSFAIPFVIHTKNRRVLSENAFYNLQVAKADVDGNGMITLAEARVYD